MSTNPNAAAESIRMILAFAPTAFAIDTMSELGEQAQNSIVVLDNYAMRHDIDRKYRRRAQRIVDRWRKQSGLVRLADLCKSLEIAPSQKEVDQQELFMSAAAKVKKVRAALERDAERLFQATQKWISHDWLAEVNPHVETIARFAFAEAHLRGIIKNLDKTLRRLSRFAEFTSTPAERKKERQ